MRKIMFSFAAIFTLVACSSDYYEDIIPDDFFYQEPTYPQRTKDDVIRILCFSSSWGINTWYYLPFMLKSVGVKYELYGLYRGGISFSEWEPVFNNRKDPDLYQFRFINNAEKTERKYTISQGVMFDEGIKPGTFDVIITNNGATSSTNASSWETGKHKMKNIFDTFLKKDGIVVFNSTWSPSIHGLTNIDWRHGYIVNNNNPERSFGIHDKLTQDAFQDTNWSLTRKWTYQMGIRHIIPNGSLMYILRNNSSTNPDSFICPAWDEPPLYYKEYATGETVDFNLDGKSYSTKVYNSELCVDGIHAASGMPSFALALNAVHTVFAPMLGFSIEDVTWRPTSITTKAMSEGKEYIPNFQDECQIYNTTPFEIPLEEKQVNIIFDAIRLAQKNKFDRVTLK